MTYNTLQHTATHCNTLQHTAMALTAMTMTYHTLNVDLQHTATHCNTLQHLSCVLRATHCYDLTRTTAHCDTEAAPFVDEKL